MNTAEVSPPYATAGPRAGNKVLFALIACSRYSGSTLLDLLLGNHSQISGSGEMNRLTLFPEDRRCTCGVSIATCAYWTRVLAEIGRPHWNDCATDLNPSTPLFDLEDGTDLALLDGGSVPPRLAAAFAEHRIALPASAVLTFGGTRDPKWRVRSGSGYILRREQRRLKVYPEATTWKNALRRIPSPLEAAVVLGGVRGLARLSSEAALHLETARNSWRVAEAMAAVDGSRVVVDSSKSAVRLKLIYTLCPERVKIIHLVRDGRAGAMSAMKRLKLPPATAARSWKRENQHLRLVLRSIPERQVHRVRYEDLCDGQERELRRICNFLEVDFEPAMMSVWDRPVHNIPGNPLLFKTRQRSIAKDERWRRDLSPDQLAIVERVTRSLNREFGYS